MCTSSLKPASLALKGASAINEHIYHIFYKLPFKVDGKHTRLKNKFLRQILWSDYL